MTNVAHAFGDREPGYFAGMPMIADETSSLSRMGDFLLVTHMGAVGGVDLTSRQLRQLAGRRDTYGGLFGPGAAPGSWDGSRELARQGYVQNTINEWHGPDRSIVSIAGRPHVLGGRRLRWSASARRTTVTTETGGREPPAPFSWSRMPRIDGGNLTGSLGELRRAAGQAAVPRRGRGPVRCRAARDRAASTSPLQDPLSLELRRRLDAAVTELVAGHPWAMFVVELGISHEERHFGRSSQTMQAVAMALPHLSPDVRTRARDYLDRLFADGVPLDQTVFGHARGSGENTTISIRSS